MWRRRREGGASRSEPPFELGPQELTSSPRTFLDERLPPRLFPISPVTMAVDSVNTPPLSEAERKIKKDAKKAAKLLRRAAAADAAAAGSDDDTPAPVVKKEKKRKVAEVEVEEAVVVAVVEGEKKVKKSKKSKDDSASAPAATTSSAPISSATPAEIKAFLEAERVSHEPEESATSYPAILDFASLPIEDGIRRGLSGYTKPTPIQSASFPVMFGGRDVIGIAETGYVLVLLPLLASANPCNCLDLERPSLSEFPPSSTSSPSPPPKRAKDPSPSSSSPPLENSPCRPTQTSPRSVPRSATSPPSASTVESPRTTRRSSSEMDQGSSWEPLDVCSILLEREL